MSRLDTIYALATAAGRAGVGVIRISGDQTRSVLEAIIESPSFPPPRKAHLTYFINPENGEHLDYGLILWFPAPNSFTGEDVAELHVHGSPAVIGALLDVLSQFSHCRLALPGEFTRRAFQNNKFDLTQAEGLADLIAAETDAQRRQAQRQMEGGLGQLYEGWRGDLVTALAHIEAEIDFPDEDLPGGLLIQQRATLERLAKEMDAHLNDDHNGERLREGCHMVILGEPNVGKSSLLNLLAKREAAIVSSQAGTTRDILDVYLNLGGFPVVLSDTAGLRDSQDDIEAEGVRRAHARGDRADVKIVVFDCSSTPEAGPEVRSLVGEGDLIIANKVDLVTSMPSVGLPISTKTGLGIDKLAVCLEKKAKKLMMGAGLPGLTRHRHRQGIEGCRSAILRALSLETEELVAEDLRVAVRELGGITGRIDVEDILDLVFRDFCIGK